MAPTSPQRTAKIGLIVGAVALALAVGFAHRNPTAGYEMSLYHATPAGVWIGAGIAAAVGTVTAVRARGRVRDAGLAVAGASALVVFTLPILRGYFFYGAGDSLSHLGFVREIAAGQLAPMNLLYPTVHVGSVAVAAVGGVPHPLATLYVVLLVFPLLFLVFTALCVRLLTDSSHGLAVGALAGLLFVPINQVSVHPNAHPASQAILFVPVVVYVVLRYLTTTPGTVGAGSLRADGGGGRYWATPAGILVVLISATVVLNHPQQALNVVVVFATIAGTQAVYRRVRPSHPISRHRRLYAQTAVITGLFLLWSARFPIVGGSVQSLVDRMLSGEPPAGEVVAERSQSIAAVGGDIVVLFVRLFLPAVVLSLIAGLLVLAVVRSDVVDDAPRVDGLLVYLAAALLPLLCVFVLFVGFGYDDMFFRYHGFIMVPVTVLGAVGIVELLRIGPAGPSPGARWLVAGLFVLLLPVASIGLHPSPYIYQPTPHVSESQVNGYETSFEHRLPEQEFVGLRGGPRRFVDAVYGTETAESALEFPGYREGLPEPVFNLGTYPTYFDEDRYLAVSAEAYDREVRLYNGFRYADQGFAKLSTTPGVSRIRSSDGFQLYYIDAGDS